MNRKMRKELQTGLFMYGIYLLSNHLFYVPEFLQGALLGTAICFEVIGILPETIYVKLKERKRLLKKIFK